MLFLTKETELIYNSNITAIYFYANWMPFNKKMIKMIDKIEKKYNYISFFAVDCDNFKGLCRRFNIEQIPTIIINNNGSETKRLNGIIMTSAFKKAFDDI